MPTGYTSTINENCTFKKFVMTCARAFGACAEMRDASSDTEIPEKFEESSYHKNQYEQACIRLELLNKMLIKEATKKAKEEYEEEVKSNTESIKKTTTQILLYECMLEQVHNWNPPTADHIELKKFMIQQITDSIKHDDSRDYHKKNKPVLMSGKEWLIANTEQAKHDIEYYTKKAQEETERTAHRNKWIKDLRDSLEK